MEQELNKKQNGSIILLVVIFSGIMTTLFGGMTSYILVQHHAQTKKIQKEIAFQIAEAGLNYYKWFLAHRPEDLQDGTGAPGPYEHEYFDPEGGAIGKFSLEIAADTQCGTLNSIYITSTGWTYDNPEIQKVLKARYARPSIAKYVFVTDNNVWFGPGEVVNGILRANGGIRMDGTHNSLVTSAKDVWNCTQAFGCAGPFEVKPGVFGAGGTPAMWQFPIEPIDFVGLASDLFSLKALAQTSGVYFSKSTDIKPAGKGYYVNFKNDGTIDVYIVNNANGHTINGKIFYQNINLPAGCGLVFFEDKVWVDGIVKGKKTVIAANLIDVGVDKDIVLKDNIEYTTRDGADGLLLVSEKDLLIPDYSPNIFKLDGIYIAQKGRLFRAYYNSNIRDKMEIYGTMVMKGVGITTWVNGSGDVVSGYRTTEQMPDQKMMYDPPPMTPYADDEHSFVKWEEMN